MPQVPELVELLKAGVHFGHQASKRHPKMDQYVYSERSQILIINLEKTAQKLKEALDFIATVVASGGTVLFVGSKRQAQAIIEKSARDCGMPYINSRWLGGTFTNFANIVKLARKLKSLEAKQKTGELEKYTKKERLEFDREIARLKELVEGIKDMEKLPQAVYLVDVKKEKTALAEAIKKGIATVALVDTNVNPEKINYPIPGNDDGTKSIELITGLVAQTIKEAKAAPSAKLKI